MIEDRRQLGHESAVLVVVSLALMLTGVVMVASATSSVDRSMISARFWASTSGRQVVFVGLGMLTLAAAWRVAPAMVGSVRTRAWAVHVGLIVSLAALTAVLVPAIADPSHGSRRWLRMGPDSLGLGFQPSELAKFALPAYLAWLLTRTKGDPKSFRGGLLPAAVVLGLGILFVGVEDFGTASLMAVVGMALLFVAGCRMRHLAMLALLGSAGMATLMFTSEYRMRRITGFLNPEADPLGAGYHPLQSLKTIVSGGWLGTGLGAGVQKYGYLPEGETDFIFSVICEEAGIVGGMMVLAMFLVLIIMGARVVRAAGTEFERLLALAFTATIGMQAIMNVSVTTVVAPTTGISLPLVSAGGSGVLLCCAAVGVLIGIARRSTPLAEPDRSCLVLCRR
jgi:cell division protein FtsW